MDYNPDKWLLIRAELSGEVVWKILATWSGGYLQSDHWRLNSGITKVEEEGDFYLFYGSSGSVYKCHKEMYGSTYYGWGQVNYYKDLASEREGASFDWVQPESAFKIIENMLQGNEATDAL